MCAYLIKYMIFFRLAYGVCFDVAGFPLACARYVGPHTVECYSALWIEAGCVEEGRGFPMYYSQDDLLVLNTMNLK